ncbi:MAG: FecR family protein, partial [Planctomycetes bacterium]|nr:FecR family protein [Planctomycetota bacterium]
GVRLELAAGRLRVSAAPRPPGSPLLVATPAATAAVVGTRFRLDADGASTRLAVEEGSVRLAAAQEVLVPAGAAALAADGLVGLAPSAPPPLPPAAGRVLWQAEAGAAGWGAPVDPGPAWRCHPPRAGDPWSRCELRGPVVATGWRVEPGARLRFTYWHAGFPPGQALTVHLKPADESNYAAMVVLDPAPGWHLAELPVDGRFRHRGGRGPLRAGESIHGLVWLIAGEAAGAPAAGRFWIGAVAVNGG